MTANRPTDDVSEAALGQLERLLAEQDAQAYPPIHLWNPEARPDIGLAIDRDGIWIHQGEAFTRQDLAKLFASVLHREPYGAYFLMTPAEKVPVHVEDVPFMAVELEVRGHGRDQKLIWRTNLDDIVVAGPEHPIRFEEEAANGGLKPYVTVRNRLEARVTRPLWHDLADMAEVAVIDGIEQFGVWSDQKFFAMAEAAELIGDGNDPVRL